MNDWKGWDGPDKWANSDNLLWPKPSNLNEAAQPVIDSISSSYYDDRVKKNITIFVHDDKVVIKNAEIIGDLAVHEHPELWGKWSVTHLPTQVSFMKAVPEAEYTKEKLINWCIKVQESFELEWDILHSLTKETYLDDSWKICRAKELIQAHCKNMRVE